MKKLMLFLTIVSLAFASQAFGQGESQLVGKWEIQYEDYHGKSIYEFRNEKGNILGYSVQFTDEDGKKYQDNTLVISEINFSGKRGTATYKVVYEENKSFKTTCKMVFVGEAELQVTYSYLGFSSKELWTKIE